MTLACAKLIKTTQTPNYYYEQQQQKEKLIIVLVVVTIGSHNLIHHLPRGH